MTLVVKLFARARDLAGAPEVTLRLPSPATVGTLRQALGAASPGLAPLIPRLLVAVGLEYARDDTVLAEGVEVACFPPVSGG